MFHIELTLSSIITTIIFSLFFALLLGVILKCNKLLANIKYELLLLCLLVPTVKILIPVEILSLTHNVHVSYLLPEISYFLYRPISGEFLPDITRYDIVIHAIFLLSALNVVKVLFSYNMLVKECNQLQLVDDPAIVYILNKLLQEQKKKPAFTLRWSDKHDSPCVFGIFNPTILIKKENWDYHNLENVLRHEIAHYSHGDLLFRYVWLLLKAFCWWNPAIYILDTQLAKIIEIRADENALKGKDIAFQKQYMETIVHMATNKNQNTIPFFASFQEKRGLVPKQRIHIIGFRIKKRIFDFVTTNLLVILLIGLLTTGMYCIIFEPYNIRLINDYMAHEAVTSENTFLIDNGDGTYALYHDNVYTCTLQPRHKLRLPTYQSINDIPQ